MSATPPTPEAVEVERLRAESEDRLDTIKRQAIALDAYIREVAELRARVKMWREGQFKTDEICLEVMCERDEACAEAKELRARVAELGLEAATINDMVCGDDGPRGHEATTRAIRKLLNELPSNPRQLASTPLPRPDGPGWWWRWSEDALPPRWLPIVVNPGCEYNDGIWVKATPPPAPTQQEDER